MKIQCELALAENALKEGEIHPDYYELKTKYDDLFELMKIIE